MADSSQLSSNGVIAFAITLALYLLLIRPWQLRWGATDVEVKRTMPGDELYIE